MKDDCHVTVAKHLPAKCSPRVLVVTLREGGDRVNNIEDHVREHLSGGISHHPQEGIDGYREKALSSCAASWSCQRQVVCSSGQDN